MTCCPVSSMTPDKQLEIQEKFFSVNLFLSSIREVKKWEKNLVCVLLWYINRIERLYRYIYKYKMILLWRWSTARQLFILRLVKEKENKETTNEYYIKKEHGSLQSSGSWLVGHFFSSRSNYQNNLTIDWKDPCNYSKICTTHQNKSYPINWIQLKANEKQPGRERRITKKKKKKVSNFFIFLVDSLNMRIDESIDWLPTPLQQHTVCIHVK